MLRLALRRERERGELCAPGLFVRKEARLERVAVPGVGAREQLFEVELGGVGDDGLGHAVRAQRVVDLGEVVGQEDVEERVALGVDGEVPRSDPASAEVALVEHGLDVDVLGVHDPPEALVDDAPSAVVVVARVAPVGRDDQRHEAPRERGEGGVAVAVPGELLAGRFAVHVHADEERLAGRAHQRERVLEVALPGDQTGLRALLLGGRAPAALGASSAAPDPAAGGRELVALEGPVLVRVRGVEGRLQVGDAQDAILIGVEPRVERHQVHAQGEGAAVGGHVRLRRAQEGSQPRLGDPPVGPDPSVREARPFVRADVAARVRIRRVDEAALEQALEGGAGAAPAAALVAREAPVAVGVQSREERREVRARERAVGVAVEPGRGEQGLHAPALERSVGGAGARELPEEGAPLPRVELAAAVRVGRREELGRHGEAPAPARSGPGPPGRATRVLGPQRQPRERPQTPFDRSHRHPPAPSAQPACAGRGGRPV